ncbi:ATP-binding protein, partial [Ruminococcaceae bacterium OttesenSCG-928-N02]|nr:ATP-binding protein [Ruminococcaceae bacterium OttesenSCG-928-N02]
MALKQFKTESKRLLEMMINSIYTNKEIFLRELISNASDALDKLHFLSLTNDKVTTTKGDYQIYLALDREGRTLTITDNGIGMSGAELEQNLGTIAKSGSLDFKKNTADDDTADIDIIGQFGVGFYASFMVADEVVVRSRKFGEEQAYEWKSKGLSGYSVSPCEKEDVGTEITLFIKADTENDKYSEFLESYRISGIVKKYSDYIRYPIVMDIAKTRTKAGDENEIEEYTERETLNS